jgi:hypothetical protein
MRLRVLGSSAIGELDGLARGGRRAHGYSDEQIAEVIGLVSL